MITVPRTVSVDTPPPDLREIRRYSSCPSGMDDTLAECIAELEGKTTYRVCFCEYPVKRTDDGLDLGFALTQSKDLSKALDGCGRLLLFAATVGFAPDRLIARYSRFSPSKALFIQAIGTERIEALCDAFCRQKEKEYAEEGLVLRPRFSPGYGDLPLELQREVFCALDCSRSLGIILNDSLLMMPSKSVTALAGIREG